MGLDVTAFCLKLERVRFDRIRLIVFCAPQYGKELARALSHLGARQKSASAVAIKPAAKILEAARALGMEKEVITALERYAAAWAPGRQGRQVQPHVQAERRAAVQAIPGLGQPSDGSV